MKVSTNELATGSQPVRSGKRPDIRSLSRSELSTTLTQMGEPAFRSKQIWEWLWNKNICSFGEMSNIGKGLRESLSNRFSLSTANELASQTSIDGTKKYLLAFDPQTSAECVAMPTGNRLTVCVSTQAGCGMGCAFCATGASGLTRSLTAAEIYLQVMHVQHDFGRRVTGVVFMGQGEPFANYPNTIRALRLLNAPDGAGIGARHLTVSTCGVIPHILRFAKEPEQFTLAVSLHSAVQRTRDMLMPGVKRWSLLRLYDAMGTYVDITDRRPSYEYALIRGINDTDEELAALCDFCRDSLAHVNLIQLNEVTGSRFRPSSAARAGEFARKLNSIGVETTIRNSRGNDIDAACGQLRQRL